MMTVIIIGLFVLFVASGSPIFVALSFAAIVANLVFLNVPGEVVAQAFFTSINSWPLICVPFFLFSGNLMGSCGPAKSLFDLCDKWVGHIRGGLPSAVVLACVLFGAVTGSGVATALAIGSLAIPELLSRGFTKQFCFGLIAVSGMLGLMIPPSVYMILFAGISYGDILEYFTAGYIPGLLIAACLIVVAVIKSKGVRLSEKASWPERGRAVLSALPALGMPIVVMGSIYSGIFTPTESSALSVIYTLIICPIFFRGTFSWKLVLEAGRKGAYTTAQCYLIVGAVYAFSAVLTYMHIPQQISEFVVQMNLAPQALLLMICLIYFLLGMIIDAVPIMYLTVPIFLPIVRVLGINELHFMILTVTMMMVGQVTPPFGLVLFALSGNFKEKIEVVVQGAIPFLAAMLFAAVLIIFFPVFATFLPGLVLR